LPGTTDAASLFGIGSAGHADVSKVPVDALSNGRMAFVSNRFRLLGPKTKMYSDGKKA
jgi:hypothetical protein